MIDLPLLSLILLGLLCARSFLSWGHRSTFHDPLSALAVGVLPEVAGGAIGGEVAGGLLGGELLGGLGGEAAASLAGGLGGELAGGLAGTAGLDIAALAPAAIEGTQLLSATMDPLTSAPTDLLGGVTPEVGATTLTTPPSTVGTAGSTPGIGPPSNIVTGGEAATGGVAAPAQTVTGPVAGSTPAADVAPTTTPGGTGGGGVNGGGMAANGSQSLLKKAGLGGADDFLKDNKELMGIAGAAAPLLGKLFGGDDKLPGQDEALASSRNLAATAAALQNNSLAGVLPQGQEAAVERAKLAGEAQIRSRYAALGMSGSSSEAQDLAAHATGVEAQRATLLDNLMKEGIQAGGLAGTGNIAAARLALEQDQEFQTALANMSKNLTLASMPARTNA